MCVPWNMRFDPRCSEGLTLCERFSDGDFWVFECRSRRGRLLMTLRSGGSLHPKWVAKPQSTCMTRDSFCAPLDIAQRPCGLTAFMSSLCEYVVHLRNSWENPSFPVLAQNPTTHPEAKARRTAFSPPQLSCSNWTHNRSRLVSASKATRNDGHPIPKRTQPRDYWSLQERP